MTHVRSNQVGLRVSFRRYTDRYRIQLIVHNIVLTKCKFFEEYYLSQTAVLIIWYHTNFPLSMSFCHA